MVIDLHSHILPGVDDGAMVLDDALEMADTAVASGVRHMIATPHYNYYGHTSNAQIRQAYTRLQEALDYHCIPLKLSLGMENIATRNLPKLLEAGEALTYPNSKYFLVEFFTDATERDLIEIPNACAEAGFLPVIAHPERYRAVLDDPSIAKLWVDQGWGVQLNRDSLLGLFGQRYFACADYMLSRGWANLIASDAHDLHRRTTNWSAAFTQLPKRIPHRILEECLIVNPRKILENIPL